MTLANFFTCLRIALIPVFGWLWLVGHHTQALWIFAIAGLTDLLDGLLARVLNQRSRLGAILDPAADKLMLTVSFLVAASVGAVPWWLTAIVIGRDVLLSGGAGLVVLLFGDRVVTARLHPSRIGKYSTFFQLATILVALIARAADRAGLHSWVAALVLIAATFTVSSGLQYVAATLGLLLRNDRHGRGDLADGSAS